jgi:hypothetical protein
MRAAKLTIGATLVALCLPAVSAAKTFEPTRKDDPNPDGCERNDCSLREAVISANERAGVDTIKLGKGRYRIEIGPVAGDVPSRFSGDLDLTTPMKIVGVSPRRTKIDAQGKDRVLWMVDQLSGERSTIKRVTLMNGDPTALSDPMQIHSGGAIYMYASPTMLDRVVITGNEALTGGGIRAQSEDLVIKRSTITGNNAGEGGGIWTGPRVEPSSRTRLTSSTISGNFANKGAGILADGFNSSGTLTPPDLDLFNSTVANNEASGDGGGVMADNASTVDLDNATVAHNKANSDGAGGGTGGGVWQGNGAVFGLGDSIVGGNSAGSPGVPQQCSGAFTGDADGLLIQTQSSGTCSYGGDYETVADPLIDVLAKNGGPTRTVRVLSGSPAIGLAGSCPGRDQRGKKRPANCDAGAFENKPKR